MRAVGIHGGRGNADALYIEDNVADPVATGDHIVVRIKAFGLNRMDIMQREDRYPYKLLPESGPILGVEFSGLVETLGPECKADFQVGHRVFGLAYGSAYAERIAVSERMLMHMPDDLDFEEAAGIPETFFTAIQAVHLVGDMQPGQSVLIHAGASGVGQAAIQVARQAGASVIFATAGTDAKCQLCRQLGADHAINYKDTSTPDFAEVVARETNGRGVDIIIDLVGQSYWHRNAASAAMEGKIVIVAAMSGSVIEGFDLRQLLNKRLSLLSTTLRTRDAAYQVRLRDVFVEQILPHLANKPALKENGRSLGVTVDEVFPWQRVGDAHKKMESNTNAGKLICVVDYGEV
ncbi:hypothetical protein SEUCBS139899_001552 [Sporothrix eucalyptigena]|uniref:Enoyl reductase (ER) domain-containing protein n=1 Tax=Sporothrix eucalyptigena TaxID=1812306 RepID=A0ABP0BKR5_9PEZI